MPGIEDFRKRAHQMTEKARRHDQESPEGKKARQPEEGPESPAERAKLRDAEETPQPEPEQNEDR
ncbi:hypothetical protein NGB36_07125 [Streptomyces sp. RB6PN25]|uniref:Uncharacterized protein n=1 Tax=Streptomyces humicola TaxID=2953240 RepID=A0ABT1PRS5_9ACTN|nr:hypothetical protein [Streptomyces humicola]MCQ4080374.1 hypothetical protein [Streptomyces humicola]